MDTISADDYARLRALSDAGQPIEIRQLGQWVKAYCVGSSEVGLLCTMTMDRPSPVIFVPRICARW